MDQIPWVSVAHLGGLDGVPSSGFSLDQPSLWQALNYRTFPINVSAHTCRLLSLSLSPCLTNKTHLKKIFFNYLNITFTKKRVISQCLWCSIAIIRTIQSKRGRCHTMTRVKFIPFFFLSSGHFPCYYFTSKDRQTFGVLNALHSQSLAGRSQKQRI